MRRHGQGVVEVPSRPLLRSRFSVDRRPLVADARNKIADHFANYELWKPQCPISSSVGIFVGNLTFNKPGSRMTPLILLALKAMSGEAADVKGDFHDNQIDGKHCENSLNSRRLLRLMKSSPTLETMAMPLNHPVCGGICGDERRALWPA